MSEEAPAQQAPVKDKTNWRQDVLAGASLGVLLGLLIGLSVSQVVAIVITALVGVLGALFGLTEKNLAAFSGSSASRLGAFATAAILVTPVAIWVRTHELLSPSIPDQVKVLKEMKAFTPREQYEMLSYIRYGFRPSATGEKNTDARPSPAFVSGLYSKSSTFCDQLEELSVTNQPVSDYETLFASGGTELKKIGERIGGLPETQKKSAFESASLFLCAK